MARLSNASPAGPAASLRVRMRNLLGSPPPRPPKSPGMSHAASEAIPSIADAVVIKDGEPFFLCPPSGQLPLSLHHGYGLFYHDTRFLGGYELRLGGVIPVALAATAATGTRTRLEQSVEPLSLADGTTIPGNGLALRWERLLDGEGPELRELIMIRNYQSRSVSLPLELTFANAFREIFTIRGLATPRPGVLEDPAWIDGALRLAYRGHDGIRRTTTIEFSPPPDGYGETSCRFDLTIPALGETRVTVRVRLGEEVSPGASPVERLSPPHSLAGPRAAALQSGKTGVPWAGAPAWIAAGRSDDILFDTVLARSFDDLAMLRGSLDGWQYYSAGLPWFGTLFGRDSLIAGIQTLPFEPGVAAATLRLLASRQGTRDDPWRDEEPGKILHELRVSELARLDRIPHTPYYGTVDATPLFLITLVRHANWTGSLDLFRELRPAVEGALGWIDTHLDRDGYLVYDRRSERGLDNQGWKDSGDCIVHADGTLAQGPVALAEVQGYVFAARRGLADLYERDGDLALAQSLRDAADGLQERFERDFWSKTLGCYGLARVAGKLCEVPTSNAGQVLWSGIARQAHAEATTARLLAPDMFGGWGVRTLSADAVAYRPLGYHTGTVWPHDNALIAEGMRRYGQDDAADRILSAMVEVAADYEHRRLPECFGAYSRAEFGVPVRYPSACHPQAWAAGTMPHLLTMCLGLIPDAFARRLRVVRPRLPAFVSHLELRGLTVGEARVDLRFRTIEEGTVVEVTWIDGDLEIFAQDPYGERVLRVSHQFGRTNIASEA